MSLSTFRKTANTVVSHVHYASVSTKFEVSYDKNMGQYIVYCQNNDNKSTCELTIGPHYACAYMVITDLIKLGYKSI